MSPFLLTGLWLSTILLLFKHSITDFHVKKILNIFTDIYLIKIMTFMLQVWASFIQLSSISFIFPT